MHTDSRKLPGNKTLTARDRGKRHKLKIRCKQDQFSTGTECNIKGKKRGNQKKEYNST